MSMEKAFPRDILDEITIAHQQHVLSYFQDGDCTQEDVDYFVKQVCSLLGELGSVVVLISSGHGICIRIRFPMT